MKNECKYKSSFYSNFCAFWKVIRFWNNNDFSDWWRLLRETATSSIRPKNALSMRHVEKTLHYSFVNLFVTRLASTFSHFAKESLLSREESKHGIVDDNRWKGRVNLGLWECRYFGWNPFTSDNTSSLNDASDVNGSICRQVSPRYNSSITHAHTYTHAHSYLPLRHAENEGEDGGACACNGAPTPCHGLRLRYWAQRDCEWTWMDRMWLPHWTTLSEQPEIRHFARYQAPISPSINPVSCRFLYLCRSMELITAMANGARTIRSEFARIANAHAINTVQQPVDWRVQPLATILSYEDAISISPSTPGHKNSENNALG